ncbi:hypothetical protein FHG87_002505 [Trinorchestia longiramus]|nr:hypothetical protein FHG87_002505 [Trinorchestia longiramus]
MSSLEVPSIKSLSRSRSLRADATALSSENLQSVSSVSSPALTTEFSSRRTVVDDLTSADVEASEKSSLFALDKDMPARETDDCDREVKDDNEEKDEEDASDSETSDEGDSPAADDDVDHLLDTEATLRPKAANGNGSVVANRTTLAATELNAEQILSQSPLFRKKFGTEKKTPTKNHPSDLSSCNTSVNAR